MTKRIPHTKIATIGDYDIWKAPHDNNGYGEFEVYGYASRLAIKRTEQRARDWAAQANITEAARLIANAPIDND